MPGPGWVSATAAERARARVGHRGRRSTWDPTAEVEILEARADKPIYRTRTTVTDQDGTVVMDGETLVYREPLPAATGRSGV